jgi:tripartite-type tricarboxylate transporter receptor subunit TctC
VRVPYKGTGPAANAVMAGDVQMLFATLGTVGPHVKQGKLRPLGVTSAKPSALAPDLPTIASVLPGYELTQIQGMFAPVKTPPALIKRIQSDVAVVLGQPEVRDRFLAQGTEPVGSGPEVLAKAMRSEMVRLDKVVKEGGIRQE